MPQIVVRGNDSADAMDQIQRLLGPDAMIVETVRRNDMVEITATNDPIPAITAPNGTQAGQTGKGPLQFSAMLAESLKKQYENQHDITLDDFYSPSESGESPIEQRRGYRSEAPSGPKHPAPLFDAGSYVLVGPKGAGKTQLGLQIAENLMQQGLDRPRLVFLGIGSVADAAYLGQKAKLLGINTAVHSVADLAHGPVFDLTRDIIVWASDVDFSLNESMVEGAHVILTLPTGMSERAQHVCLDIWQNAKDVILSQSMALPASHDDSAPLIKLGRRLVAISDKSRVINALHSPAPLLDDLQPSKIRETPQHTTTDADALPTLLRKRWGGTPPPQTQPDAPRVVPLLRSGQPHTHPMREGAKA